MWRTMIYGILMWAVTIYAFRRGGWEEKLASSSLVVVSYLTPLVHDPAYESFHHFEFSIFILDIIYFLITLIIVLRTKKFWPIWVAAMSAMVIMAHLLPFMPLPREIAPYLYFRAEALWSWPTWVVIGIGVRRHSTRARMATG